MADIIVEPGVGFVNLSPDAFHRWAEHYYKCKQDFACPHRFSPVPYFLLCRSIELSLKARHLDEKRQPEVKNNYGHNLRRAYEELDPEHKILSELEFDLLRAASDIYKDKGFEYFNPEDALTGYSRFPDLDRLDGLAKKIVDAYDT